MLSPPSPHTHPPRKKKKQQKNNSVSEFSFNHVGKSSPSFETIHVKSSLQGSQAELSIYVSKYATVKSC